MKSKYFSPLEWMVIAAIVMVLAGLAGFGLTSCSPARETAQGKSQATTEEYTKAATQAVPYPLDVMKQGGWLERMNIRERLTRFADRNKISYITLITRNGQVFAQYTVKGKVSSVSSQLTTSETVNDYCGSSECKIATPAPMDDGTWGPSEDAIFFFDTAGVYHQWPGEYLLSDAPQDITTPPVLVYNTNSQPTSVGDKTQYGGN